MLKLLFIAKHRNLIINILALATLLLTQGPTCALAAPPPANTPDLGEEHEPSAAHISSPYAYPTPDDSAFVSSSSSQLGQYVSSGYIDIYIPINRVFTTKSVKDAVAKRILPETSELIISFFANEPKHCWPMHRITLNGHELPWVMPRAEGHWLLTTIPFPTIYLDKLPKQQIGSPPTPEWQKVRIYVDTAHCQCGLEVQWGLIKVNAPRPVVLVHGWSGNLNSWVDFTRLLDEDGMPYVNADLANGIKPIPATGAILSGQIHQALIELGVQKINLITHSKGGLFARWALDNDVAPMVERLITLAAPHHGVSDASLFFAKANNCPNFGSSDPYEADECQVSADETSISRVRDDLNYTDCKLTASMSGIPIYTGCILKANAQPDIAYYSIVGSDDGIVDNASSTYPWKADASPYPLSANVDVTLPGRGHFTVKAGRAELNCAMGLIHPRAYTPCGGQFAASAAQSASAMEAEQSSQQLIWVTHTLLSGAQALPVYFDAAEHASILINANHAVSVSLTTPTGEHIAPTQVDAGFVKGNMEYRGNIDAIANEHDWAAVYRIISPTAGLWTVHAIASDEITVPVHMTLGAWVSASTQLTVLTDKPMYRTGEIVRLTTLLANVGQPLANSLPMITGILHRADTSPLVISFVDDGTQGDPVAGDGRYTASFAAPASTALSFLPLEITAVKGNLRRQAFAQLAISPDSGRIDSQVPVTATITDSNRNQLYESLTLSPTLYISRTGHFRLTGDLADAAGVFIAHTSTASHIANQPWGVGYRAVPLHFAGVQIRLSGRNGPYRLANLRLFDESASAILIDSLASYPSFVISPLSRYAFQGVDPIITHVIHQAIDTDGNGRFNQLVFTATLSGTNAGDHLWGAWLVDTQGGRIAWTTGQGMLTNDTATIRLDFDSPAIRLNAQHGPYRLAEIVLQQTRLAGFYGRLIQLATDYATPRYTYTEFDDGRSNQMSSILDLSTRQAAVDFYRQEYQPDAPSLDWTGNLTDCLPGEVSPAYQAALLQRVNYFRRMAGLPSAVLSSTLSTKAQAAALYMARNKSVSHGLDASLPCYTQEANEAAQKSNLHASFSPIASLTAIDGYVRDTGLESLGHRRWLLLPQLEQIGSGDIATGDTNFRVNVLYLITSNNLNAARPAPRGGFVAWPSPGYVPYQVVYPYWSFSIAGADLISASVRMLKDGVPISVTVAPVAMRYGDNALAWVPLGLDANDRTVRWPQPESGHEPVYTVIIDHVGVNNAYRRFTYTVTMIDPNTAPPVMKRMWLPMLSNG